MGGGELFNAIQEKQSFNERGKSRTTIYIDGQNTQLILFEKISTGGGK